jgi:hypothetical protein
VSLRFADFVWCVAALRKHNGPAADSTDVAHRRVRRRYADGDGADAAVAAVAAVSAAAAVSDEASMATILSGYAARRAAATRAATTS